MVSAIKREYWKFDLHSVPFDRFFLAETNKFPELGNIPPVVADKNVKQDYIVLCIA